jgi:hypothetical protein
VRGHHRLTIDPAAENLRDPRLRACRVPAGGDHAAVRAGPGRHVARRAPGGSPHRRAARARGAGFGAPRGRPHDLAEGA